MGNQIMEASGMKAWWKKKILRDLIKFGVREQDQGKKYLIVILPLHYLTFMFNAASSHKHKFIGTNLRRIISAALEALELVLNAFQLPDSTQSDTIRLLGAESCLLRICNAVHRKRVTCG